MTDIAPQTDTVPQADPAADLTQRIGNRLRQARHDQKLSLSELAERTGCYSKSRISNYEQGLRRMGLEESMALAAALGTVSATWLLCLDDNAPLDPAEAELIARYRAADEAGQASLREFAQSLPAAKPKRAKKA
ncbi:helix-turn-helix transcriptional regulator [uncultured Thiodictyon sp.]|uniref:helix-turn-helix domain-containing protein n=1 Tax=uncultured Thiodictyon sp. TaxID=1846217 RepID=UPI0025FE8982|nr:helix-turn-helix transcriptional regulator [uncultured Thiodictyon sp.]